MIEGFDPDAYVERLKFRFAKSVPETPHWYCFIEHDDPEFGRLKALIERDGWTRRWHGRTYAYLTLRTSAGQHDYWVTWHRPGRWAVNRRRAGEHIEPPGPLTLF